MGVNIKANCIFPHILDRGCAHSDYRCVCENMPALDDVEPMLEDLYVLTGSDNPEHERESGSFRDCVEECSLLEQLRRRLSYRN